MRIYVLTTTVNWENLRRNWYFDAKEAFSWVIHGDCWSCNYSAWIQNLFKRFHPPISILRRSAHQSQGSICKGSYKIYCEDEKKKWTVLFIFITISICDWNSRSHHISIILFDWHENYRLSKSLYHLISVIYSYRASMDLYSSVE